MCCGPPQGLGADTGGAPQNGWTPLLLAASARANFTLQILLNAGADTEAKQKVGGAATEGFRV